MTFLKINSTLALCGSLLMNPLLVAAQSETSPTAAPPISDPSSYTDYALRQTGDAQRGRLLFGNEQKAACVKCHTVDGSSGRAGPDLSAIGDKFPRRELVRAVLEPSASIAIGYGTTVVETRDGEEIQGVLKQSTESHLELMGADGRGVRVAADKVQSQRTSTLSLMPENLVAGLTREEFSDLIAYLESLRLPATGSSGIGQTSDEIPRAAQPVTFTPFFRDSVRFTRPVWFASLPHQVQVYVVLEHAGQSWLVERRPEEDRMTPLLDLRETVRVGGATGLLGLAFHPRFAENRKYYLKYHIEEQGRISTLIVERQFTPHFRSDAGTNRILLKIPSVTQDHNGGCLEFGPDGYLYIGMGDTGPQRDPQGHGQDLSLFLGKILRIDVDHANANQPYAIPADNPFRDQDGVRPEIWAYGFREPWRFSFDAANGDLWVGDVGQDRYEEVAIVRRGENHGWNVYEGFNEFSDRYRRSDAAYVPPIFSYSHRHGVSITGGHVYRGQRAPHLRGWYVCADFETRRVWALTQTNRVLKDLVEIGRAPTRAVSFTQERDGELYLVGYDDGGIYHLDLDRVDLTPLQIRIVAETSEKSPMDWRYTFNRPAEDWFESEFADTAWQRAPGGFGTQGTPGAVVRTEWRGREIWLRREFTLAPDAKPTSPEKVSLRIHHDEDAEVYLNGVLAARLSRWTTGYTEIPLSTEAAAALRVGRNVLAIHCRQNSGGQYIDAGLVEWMNPQTTQKNL